MAEIIPWQGAEWPPRDWQAKALPIIIGNVRKKRRGIVCAVMGAGKSILQAELVRMAHANLGDRVIIVCAPRQRLVDQLADTMAGRLGRGRVGRWYGKKKQVRPVIVCCNNSLPTLHVELASLGKRVALLIVDEAHRSEAASVRDTVPELKPAALVGFTATPFRSVPTQTVSLFDCVHYRYGIEDAVRDRVLVPPRVERWQGSDGVPIDEACLAMMNEHADGPGITSATSIDDAEEHAEWLTANGWPAEAVHSRLTTTEQDARLERLRTGQLRAIVHVALLSEGVDLPWLRWLCLRRNVQASVRFLQEVGRVLRVDREPDPQWGTKTDGVVLDPHLLLGRFGWTTPEAIGQAMEEAAEAEAAEPTAARGPTEPREDEALALDVLLAYLRRARAELERAGICPPRTVAPGGWQLAPVSAKQVAAVKGASKLTRHIPGECRDPIKALSKVPWVLTRGQVADLLDVLYGGSRWARVEAGRLGQSEPWRLQWDPGALRVGGDVPGEAACKSVHKLGRRIDRLKKKTA
jgi:hypothetical protein